MYGKELLLVLIYLAFLQEKVNGHGMMIDPPNRSSRWRYDESAPINYDDNELFCGGFGVQWDQNGGLCGICGDSYSSPRPRANELGGIYGQGVIVANFKPASVITVKIQIDQNHKGYFTFSLCNLDNSKEEEECFQPLLLDNGSDKTYLPPGNANFTYNLQLPQGLSSQHSVLRWQYRSGNNWGTDPNGNECLGCGPQETYRTCTDISIL